MRKHPIWRSLLIGLCMITSVSYAVSIDSIQPSPYSTKSILFLYISSVAITENLKSLINQSSSSTSSDKNYYLSIPSFEELVQLYNSGVEFTSCMLKSGSTSGSSRKSDSSSQQQSTTVAQADSTSTASNTLSSGSDGDEDGDKNPNKRGTITTPSDKEPIDCTLGLCPVCQLACSGKDSRTLACCGQKVHKSCAAAFCQHVNRCQCGKQFLLQYACTIRHGSETALFSNQDDLEVHFIQHLAESSGYSFPFLCSGSRCSHVHTGYGSRCYIQRTLLRNLRILCPSPTCSSLAPLSYSQYQSHYQESHSSLTTCPVDNCNEQASHEHMINEHAYCSTTVVNKDGRKCSLGGTLSHIVSQFITQQTSLSYCAICEKSPNNIFCDGVQTPIFSPEDLLRHFLQIHAHLQCPFCSYSCPPSNNQKALQHISEHGVYETEEDSISEESESNGEESNNDIISVCPLCQIALPNSIEEKDLHIEECIRKVEQGSHIED